MRYNLFICNDSGTTTEGLTGNTSISFTENNEILEKDSKPVVGRGILVMNTSSGQSMNIESVKQIFDVWTSYNGNENVLFTVGNELYHWWYSNEDDYSALWWSSDS